MEQAQAAEVGVEDRDAAFVVGVDTGGTFTDVVVIDRDGATTSAKASTTPGDLAAGVLEAIRRAAAELGLELATLLGSTSLFRLSGTTVTNALITRQGVPTGLLTTAGFEDTLDIGRAVSAWAGGSEEQIRRTFRQEKPSPIVPASCGVASTSESTPRGGSSSHWHATRSPPPFGSSLMPVPSLLPFA